MVEYILGNYLVETGKITKDQLNQVLTKQDTVRVKLGLIAVEEGLITIEQADEVNRMQALMDRRFGDIAVSKGYLTEAQIEKLLKQQGSAYLIFVQALVDEQLITMEEIDLLLNDFKRQYGYSNSELEDIKSDDVDRIVPLLLPDEAKKYQGIVGTAVRTLIRLINRHTYLGWGAMVDAVSADDMVCQALAGENGIVTCFSERDGALLNVCCSFGQENFEYLDLDSLDAAGELLNCINGLYASEMSRKSVSLELMPPEYDGVLEQIRSGSICRVPIFVRGQGLYFTVAEIM